MSHPLPPKKEVALALLERSSVHVHLDPRGAGVVVPPWFKRQPQLVLQVGLNMPVPIPDLRLDEQGMSCTLSFNRSPFYCVVPWASVFAMVGDDGRGMVWPDDVPPEISKQRPNEGVEKDKDRQKETEKEKERSQQGEKRQRPAAQAGAPRAEEAREEKPAAPSKGKKGKKKRAPAADEPRPQLVAVPPSEASEPAPGPRPVPRPPSREERPRAVPPAKKTPSKPKRELPPYLRVVK
jgi:stringent starvation protein B